MQRKKCCWCEQRLGYRSEDVDHFRPKTKARRTVKRYDEGYWWLAYDRDNLFFSCAACSTTIQRVKLDRDDLDELRDDWVADELRPVRRRFEQARHKQDRHAARAEALRLCAPERSFSLLARCYFVEHGVGAAGQ
ncbi:MAG TPA: hypothetical protein VEU33_02705 [Archangium sp.]|nr:hypothetical protein [Archangium sp.]